jgi:hypothetical protein
MGKHTDPDALACINWLDNKGKQLGYIVEKECHVGDNEYFIDVVWKYKHEQQPIITFEIETTNQSSIASNILKLFCTEQSHVRKPFRHFMVILKSDLTSGQKNMLKRIIDYEPISVYESLSLDAENKKRLEKELDNLLTNRPEVEEPIVSFLKAKILYDTNILQTARAKFGNELPFMLKDDIVHIDETHPFFLISAMMEYLNVRLPKLRYAKDIDERDFDMFFEIISLAERIDAKKNILTYNKICPKCGFELSEWTDWLGGGYGSDLICGSVITTIGCKKCCYEASQETKYL